MADDLHDRIGGLSEGQAVVRAAAAARDGPAGRDAQRAARRRTCTTPRSRRSRRRPIPADLDPALREARTIDGTYNDLHVPKMGSVGCRFGRNVPLEHTFPDTPNLLIPNPRVVSRELMTRDSFSRRRS